MRKKITFLTLIANLAVFSQWDPQNSTSSTEIFRNEAIGIGYTSLPVFNPFKFKVNGTSQFENGGIVIGNNYSTWNEQNIPNFKFAIKLEGSMVMRPKANEPAYSDIGIIGSTGSILQIAAANCSGCYASDAVAGDLVIRTRTSGSVYHVNERGGDVRFQTGTSSSTVKTAFRIDPIGNIGIGTGNNPIATTDKLAVNGLIHAKEVKIDLVGWPDYVFEKEYKLPTLTEVEQHIKREGHLINIPNAKDIETNGLLLGEITKKQQEKIEELTLYIIEQNKINEKQAKEIEELKLLVKQLLDKK